MKWEIHLQCSEYGCLIQDPVRIVSRPMIVIPVLLIPLCEQKSHSQKSLLGHLVWFKWMDIPIQTFAIIMMHLSYCVTYKSMLSLMCLSPILFLLFDAK